MVKKAGDGEGADATFCRSDGGKVGAGVELGSKVAFDDAFFAGSASIYKSGAGGNKLIRNQTRDARGTDYYIKVLKVCQVAALVKESDAVI